MSGHGNTPFSHAPSSHPSSFAAACASLQAMGHSALLSPTTGGSVLPPHPQCATIPPAIHSAFPSHLNDYASLLYRPLAAAGALPGYLPMSSNLLAARLSSKFNVYNSAKLLMVRLLLRMCNQTLKYVR